jgi:hypothetical protein
MMMHRKIIELRETARQVGRDFLAQELIVPRAGSLNTALIELAETLERLLPPQEQNLGTLDEKIELFQTAQEIARGGNVSFLLGQIPEATRIYLQKTLGLEWDKAGEYLTAANLDEAIKKIEKQKTQIGIVSQPKKNKASFAHDPAELLLSVPLTADDALKPGIAPTQNVLLYSRIDDYIKQNYSTFEINYKYLQELSRGMLPAEHAAQDEYFVELTTDVKKALALSGTDLCIIRNGKEYLAVTSEDKVLLERQVFAAYLNTYEKALLDDYLKISENVSNKGVSGDEVNTMLIDGLSRNQKKVQGQQAEFKPEDTLKLYKLLSEMAILKYNYRDVDSGGQDWQFYRDEAAKTLNTIKAVSKKKVFQELEKETNEAVKNWTAGNGFEELPAPETAEPEKRRGGIPIKLPQIDTGALKDTLRGLAGDPRTKRVLAALLALLLLAGGGAGVLHLLKNRQPENAVEAESFFTRAFNTVRDIFNDAGKRLSELFADQKKTAQELKTEGDQIIQEAKATAENAIQSEETNLTPEEAAEVRAETKRAETLQVVTDTYLQAREEADKTQAQEYDKTSYTAAGETLDSARAALDAEAEKHAADDTIVRPLAEKLSADLQDRAEQIKAEIERQDKLAAEAAAEAEAAAKKAAEAAERAKVTAAQENRLAESLNRIKTVYNANSLILRNVIRYNNLYAERDVELARAYQALATNPEEYFKTKKISSLSAKAAEAEAKAAGINSFIDSLNADLENVE